MMSSSATFKIVLSNIVVAALVATYMSSADQQHGDFKGLRKLQVSIPAFDGNAALGSIAASVNTIGGTNTGATLPGAFVLQTGVQVEGVLSQVKAAPGSFIPGNLGDGGAASGSLNSDAANFLLPSFLGATSASNGALSSIGKSRGVFSNLGSDNGAISAVGSAAAGFIPAALGSGAVAGTLPVQSVVINGDLINSIGSNAASILPQSTP
jgi:hypothetical protein